jgi:hypothetical protein
LVSQEIVRSTTHLLAESRSIAAPSFGESLVQHTIWAPSPLARVTHHSSKRCVFVQPSRVGSRIDSKCRGTRTRCLACSMFGLSPSRSERVPPSISTGPASRIRGRHTSSYPMPLAPRPESASALIRIPVAALHAEGSDRLLIGRAKRPLRTLVRRASEDRAAY